ncbi:MAG: HNH endonuclease [Roseobacter sp.]|jgi:hypothetical protein|nr:HNH endonuclease [Roseobacter sp.]
MKQRNYRKEYDDYHGKPEQVKRRAGRNSARAKMVSAGKAKKGDGKDIHHKDGNPRNNSRKNLSVMSRSRNRARRG